MSDEEREALVRRGVAALDQPDAPEDEPDDDVPADANRATPARRDVPADTDELPDSIMVGAAKPRDRGGAPQRARWTRRWQ